MSPIMAMAERAAKIVASWSKSKQEYAKRILNQHPEKMYEPCQY